jgi:epoxyqueuosine reductase
LALNGLVHDRKTEFKQLAAEAGFELAGVAPVIDVPSYTAYNQWVADGMHGPMEYLAGRRASLRRSAIELLPSARSVLCLGKLYNTSGDPSNGVSRYAWGAIDYHDLLRERLEVLLLRLRDRWGDFQAKTCVDTSPLLERAYANLAGLGWIGKNTCLINEPRGSWYFLGEILISIEIPPDFPPPDRCGSCRRCIDACPTGALVPAPTERGWQLDARLCISTWTIEQRGVLPEQHRAASGSWIFGCDICQEVCPWNRRAPESSEPGFRQNQPCPSLGELAALTPEQFRERFRKTPLWRMKYEGMLRNVCTAIGNSRDPKYQTALKNLQNHEDAAVREHASWALAQLDETNPK